MSTTRTVRPTDVVALVSFDGRIYPNEAWTWDRLGDQPASRVLSTAVEQWFSFATGRHTWVSLQGQTLLGLISARRRDGRAAWEVDCLIAAADSPERVALNLFDRLSADAVQFGVQKLFLRVAAGSEMVESARQTGFVGYVTEWLLRLDQASFPERPLPAGLVLRPRERADEHALYQLYNAAAPPDVRLIEALTFAEWKSGAERRGGGRGAADVVGERDGRIVARLRTSRDGEGGRADLLLHPDEWPSTEALLSWLVRDLRDRRPIHIAVPFYARPVAERMESSGFVVIGEYALLAKRLAQPIWQRRPVRARAKPVATV